MHTIRILLLVFSILNIQDILTKQLIQTVWGTEEMEHPLLEELLTSHVMQRLKKIDQSGPTRYFKNNGKDLVPSFLRYDHSIGVWALTKKAGASIPEQAAALAHDASHTAFSHLADILFNHNEIDKNGSYQDSIHLWFLEKMEITPIISRYGLTLEQLEPDLSEYTALEQPSPSLCADRIQYIIHTGVIFNLITEADARTIVESLIFENKTWIFTDKNPAKQFALLSLYFTKHLWGAPYNHAFYQCFSIALREAFKNNLFTKEDFLFGTDQDILDLLLKSNSPTIIEILAKCSDIYSHFTIVPYGDGTYNFKPKCRGVDPLVKNDDGTIQKLTEIDSDYKKEFESTKKWCQEGYGLVTTFDTYK